MSELKLAISNIAWDKADDEAVYAAMQQNGFTGLEIAPTRIFPEYPYENLTGAALFGGYLLNRWGFHVPSMQSIWYGQTGNIFDAVGHHLADSSLVGLVNILGHTQAAGELGGLLGQDVTALGSVALDLAGSSHLKALFGTGAGLKFHFQRRQT